MYDHRKFEGISRNYTTAMTCSLLLLLIILAFYTVSAKAGTTSYMYDTLGRIIKVTYPDAKQICYQYDKAGNRTQVNRAATGTCTPATITLVTPANLTIPPPNSDGGIFTSPDLTTDEASSIEQQ